eukprot:Phypoly_transcript_03864.p1 GENE.Phypoly_transcript_03864~~Phypoly_transcript_03864.p1  ORF type:complete len:697 (+),score=96.19 Phypoly_transcript_03864:81-2171(+)
MPLSFCSCFLFLFVLCRCLLSSSGLEINVIVMSHVTCYGEDDGMAMVNVTEGTPPYKYLWPSTNDNKPTSNRLSAGAHNVTVKDATNVVATKTFYILQPAKLVGGEYSYGALATCNKLGSVSAQVHGGTPPYAYTWVASSIDTEFTILSAPSPTVIFDESLNSAFTPMDGNGQVNLHSGSVQAYSGLWSIKIDASTAQKFSFVCASDNPSCISSDEYRGIQFWIWKEDAEGKITVGLVDQNGFIVEEGSAQFGFTAQTWSMAFLDFQDLPPSSYWGIFFATNGPFSFHIDDVVLLPKEEKFVSGNGTEESLPINTPSAIYGPAGEYSLRVLDNNECSALLALSINTAPELQNSASVDDKKVTVSTKGGTPPYTYNMMNGSFPPNTNGVFSDVTPGNYTIEIVDSGGCKDIIDVSVIHHIPINPPINPGNESFSKYKVVNSLLGILAGICALLTILCSYLVHKRKADLRPHSLLFCQTILIGAFLGYIAAILAIIEVSWARCIAFAWAVDFSVTIIYGSMFAKSMQILKILDNFTKFVSIDTTDRYMAKVFCFIIVPELLLLAIWTGLTGTVFQAKITAGKAEVIFWIIFLVYKSIVGFIASFVCFRMRFKFKEYLEIQQIAYCHFTLEVLLLFLLVFTLIARESYTELFVGVQSFSVSAIVSIPLLVIISPILRRALKEYREEKKTKKWQKLTMYT